MLSFFFREFKFLLFFLADSIDLFLFNFTERPRNLTENKNRDKVPVFLLNANDLAIRHNRRRLCKVVGTKWQKNSILSKFWVLIKLLKNQDRKYNATISN